MVNVPEPVQSVLPVSVHLPVITVPFSVPVRVSVLPAGVPDCTVNDRGPVTTLLPLVVTFNVPLADDPEAKQLPVVMNSMPDMFNDASPFTENVVIKLSPDASPLPPVSTACQVPLAVAGAVFVLLLLPHPERFDASARSATTTSRFMFTLELDWSAVVQKGCSPPMNGCKQSHTLPST